MASMIGACSYATCEVQDGENLAVAPCTACQKPVHHFCSNAVFEGALDVRFCSTSCRDHHVKPSPPIGHHAECQPDHAHVGNQSKKRTNSLTTVQGTSSSKRGRSSRSKENPPTHLSSVDTSNAVERHSTKPTKNSTSDVGVLRRPKVSPEDAQRLQQVLDQSDSDGQSNQHQGRQDDVHVRAGGAIEHAGQVEAAVDTNSNAKQKQHKAKNLGNGIASKKKKFYFTQDADLALLKEILSIEPYAAGHGEKAQKYQLEAENLSEHLEAEIHERTVKGRMKLLLKDFEREDLSSRKKTGVAETYSELQRLLQDIKDRIQDVKGERVAKKQQRSLKTAKLQSQGEILRAQAVKRRSERDQTDTESFRGVGENAEVLGADTMASIPEYSQHNSSKSLVNSAGIVNDFMKIQAQTREENKQFQVRLLQLKAERSEKEAWKWEEELNFKKWKYTYEKQKWEDERDLRRQELQIRKEELKFLRDQLHAKGKSGADAA
ncbi:hypothetical protein DVH05_004400 [Phytophthora capsici]|nr:hypothetical protein DVH05_004400 [Phytophthora capsici]